MMCICGQRQAEHDEGDGFCSLTCCFKFRPAGVVVPEFDFDAACEATIALYYRPCITERIQ